ncbi:response regulator [Lachnoclostridium sp.]|uniref:response regulator n=2 Tax=Lachnoclostridium sp. TaxID=2028282 RepID=UPI002897DB4D|nr:response regulator [Lachnoclostridium sp.]
MIKVVIVEDDLMVAAINKQYIQKTPGLDVVATFHNGKDAWEFIKNTEVQLLILDLYMPNISGLELLQIIREAKYQIDVIMVTAANDVESLDTALHLGILDYLVKPFMYERFSKAIDKYLLKNKMIKSGIHFKQEDVDELINLRQEAFVEKQMELSKGLQDKTIYLIRGYMNERKNEFLTSEEISAHTGLSKVTVRRYMNYFIESNEVISEVDYRTGGRPSIKYKIQDKRF